jgi:GAF domain-containing protein
LNVLQPGETICLLKPRQPRKLHSTGWPLDHSTGGSDVAQRRPAGIEDYRLIGDGFIHDVGIRVGEGIIGGVANSGKAEIVDDVRRDGRSTDNDLVAQSMVCVPLHAKHQVIGVIVMVSSEPNIYMAGDLKLLNTLASQAAPAIENALIYEKTLQEAQEREARLQKQIRELRIELDEARQAKQVEEITETDYFKRLHQQALLLRGIMEGESR